MRRGRFRSTLRPRDERGASALELAFLAPGLLLLIFLCMQGALFFYGRNVAIQSAREGVSQLRLAQDRATYDDIRPRVVSNTEQYATSIGRESLIDPIAVADYDDENARAKMTVTGRVITLVPGLNLTVTEVAEGPVERFSGSGP